MKKNVFSGIKAYFKEKEMEYIFSEENNLFALKIKLIFDTVDFLIEVDEKKNLIQFFSVLPLKCKKEARLVAESFLEKINSEAASVYGAFRFSDMGGNFGDVFYHYAFHYDEKYFNADIFDKSMTHCLMMSDVNYLNIKRIFQGQLNVNELAEYKEKVENALKLINEETQKKDLN